jgi:hypothetical protein
LTFLNRHNNTSFGRIKREELNHLGLDALSEAMEDDFLTGLLIPEVDHDALPVSEALHEASDFYHCEALWEKVWKD